ncbi:unnamed protein product, partial [Pylaiella littoralis]
SALVRKSGLEWVYVHLARVDISFCCRLLFDEQPSRSDARGANRGRRVLPAGGAATTASTLTATRSASTTVTQTAMAMVVGEISLAIRSARKAVAAGRPWRAGSQQQQHYTGHDGGGWNTAPAQQQQALCGRGPVAHFVYHPGGHGPGGRFGGRAD